MADYATLCAVSWAWNIGRLAALTPRPVERIISGHFFLSRRPFLHDNIWVQPSAAGWPTKSTRSLASAFGVVLCLNASDDVSAPSCWVGGRSVWSSSIASVRLHSFQTSSWQTQPCRKNREKKRYKKNKTQQLFSHSSFRDHFNYISSFGNKTVRWKVRKLTQSFIFRILYALHVRWV